MRKIISFVLALVLLAGLGGCTQIGQIAEEVAAAARQELENQVRATLEEHKIEVVEMKTAFGDLNDDGGKLQLFCAMLVRCESEAVVKGCVTALDTVFEQTGMQVQTGSTVESEHLVKKGIAFDHCDYTDGTYYLVYGYISSFTGK